MPSGSDLFGKNGREDAIMIYQVLIVDDEELVCRGLTEFIHWKELGFAVAGTANNVEDALTLLKALPVKVILLDIRMPEKSGLTLLPVLKESYPDIKTIILSGYSDFSYAQEALRYSVRDYLTKPVNLVEMETLLTRLHEELDQQNQELQVHESRMQALLLSAAKGYSKMDSQSFQFPALSGWFGLSMSLRDRQLPEEVLYEKKNFIKKQLSSVFPDTIVLSPDAFSLFLLIPCSLKGELEDFLVLLEELCPHLEEWAAGASEWKNGIQALPAAWQEAEQALRYHRADSRKGITRYGNIKILLTQNLPQLEQALSETLNLLTDISSRADVILYVQDFLEAVREKNYGLIQYQIFCIRFLIELNGRLSVLNLTEISLHEQLNQCLSALLLRENYQDTIDHVIDYLKWLVEQLNLLDEKQYAKGAIREIQLYIRQHYAENLSLQLLAGQFYFHPNYLSKLFKLKTGQTFVEYLTQVRIEKAKELLLNTDCKVIDICAMIGYDNPRYFCRLFKKYTGMVPGEYRRHMPSVNGSVPNRS